MVLDYQLSRKAKGKPSIFFGFTHNLKLTGANHPAQGRAFLRPPIKEFSGALMLQGKGNEMKVGNYKVGDVILYKSSRTSSMG